MIAESPTRTFGIRAAAQKSLRENGIRGMAKDASEFLRARWYLRKVNDLGAVRLQGKARVRNNGRMSLGDRMLLESTIVPIELVTWKGAELTIGERTYINYGTNISATSRVTIGANCAIGQYSIIMDNDYHSLNDHRAGGRVEPITIEDNVWMGARVIVLRGSHIGNGAVIGANSLVNGYIPPNALAAGSPAKVIRYLKNE